MCAGRANERLAKPRLAKDRLAKIRFADLLRGEELAGVGGLPFESEVAGAALDAEARVAGAGALVSIEMRFDGVVVVCTLVREDAVGIGAVGEDAVDVELSVAVLTDVTGDGFVARLIGCSFIPFNDVAVDDAGDLADEGVHLALGGAVLRGEPLAVKLFRGDGGCGEERD